MVPKYRSMVWKQRTCFYFITVVKLLSTLLTPGTPRAFPLLTLGLVCSFSSSFVATTVFPSSWCTVFHLKLSQGIFLFPFSSLPWPPMSWALSISLWIFQYFWVCPTVLGLQKASCLWWQWEKKFVLWPRLGTTLENVPDSLEESMSIPRSLAGSSQQPGYTTNPSD